MQTEEKEVINVWNLFFDPKTIILMSILSALAMLNFLQSVAIWILTMRLRRCFPRKVSFREDVEVNFFLQIFSRRICFEFLIQKTKLEKEKK